MGVRLAAFLLCFAALAKEGEGINLDARNTSEELEEISALMQSMATDLRNDQTHERVQIEGKEIEDRIEKLCRWHEENDRRRKEISEKSGDRGHGSPQNRKGNQRCREGVGFIRCWNAVALEAVRGSHGESEQIPAKWKVRIEAYFVSIAAAK